MGLETVKTPVSYGCWAWKGRNEEERLTVAEITQVQQLIAPLRENSQTILHESDNDQETANGGQITRTEEDTVSARWTGQDL